MKTDKTVLLHCKTIWKVIVISTILVFSASSALAQPAGEPEDDDAPGESMPDTSAEAEDDTAPPTPTPTPPRISPAPPVIVPEPPTADPGVPVPLGEEAEDEIVIAIDDYLDAPVITASKRVEKTAEAPAIVSVITADDIEEMAPENLYNIISTLPGVELFETYYGYTSITFRGIMQTNYNDKSLMLVNGTPLYDTANFSYYLEQMPMNAIRQIEVVRGPGSTLYGTNAFAGVLNFIPYDGTTVGKTKLYARYGSFNTLDMGFSGGFSAGPLAVFLAGSRKDSDGYPFIVKVDEQGQSGEPVYPGDRDAYEADWQNVYANVKFHDLMVSANYFKMEKDKMGLTAALVGTGERTMEGMFADARYALNLGEMITVSPSYWFSYMEKEEDIAWYPPSLAAKYGGTGDPKNPDVSLISGGPEYQTFSGYKTGAELRVDFTPIKMLQITAGGVAEYTYLKNYLFNFASESWNGQGVLRYAEGERDNKATAIGDALNTTDVAGFLQADARLFDRLGLIAGVRLSHNSDVGLFLAPRAGLVVTVLEDLHAKLLYGRAFRYPSFFEKDVLTQGVLFGGQIAYTDSEGNNQQLSLDVEQVDTVDLGFDWKINRHSFRLNGFWLTTDSMIDRVRNIRQGSFVGGIEVTNPNGVAAYGNSDGYWITGLEFEYRAAPIQGMKTFFNLSWRYGQTKDEEPPNGEKDLQFFAPILANLGVNYNWVKLLPWLRTGIYLQAVSERSGPKLTRNAENRLLDQGATMTLDPYFLLSVNVTARLSENLDLSVIAHNLLDWDYSYPEYVRRQIDAVPGGPPAAVFGKLQLNF